MTINSTPIDADGVLEDARTRTGVWHPNGFVVIKLDGARHGCNDSESLRLHIWPKKRRVRLAYNPPVHDHMWSFTSTVIAGCLHERLYEVLDHEKGRYERFVAHYGAGNDSVALATGQRVTLRRVASLQHHAGEGYALETRQFHSSHADSNSVTATIMRTGPADGPAPQLIAVAGRAPLPYTRPALTSYELSQVLSELGCALGRSSG